MSASISHAQTPTIATSNNQTAPVATSPAAGPSANVATGSAQPTARSSYASATKKISSPPIASSAVPPVAVGGPQSAHHGKSSSISPVNGKTPIQPAVPTMAPTIVNGTPVQGDHSRKSSVTISAAGTSGHIPNGGPVTTSRAPSNLTFGSIAGSPAPAHVAPHRPQGASLNPQMPNPRVASPAHSPSPIPTTNISGGKPEALPTRPGLVFGGGSDSTEPNVSSPRAPNFNREGNNFLTQLQARPSSMPPQQPNSLPQAQHLRHESSQSAHSDISNANMNMNRGYPSNSGRGRGGFNPTYNPQMGHNSPQPYRPLPNQPRGGPNMAAPFQPQGPMHPNSPYRATRSPAITPATMHQQAHMANPGMPYGGYGQPQYPQPVRIPSNISYPSFISYSSVSESSKPSQSANFSQPAQQFSHSPNLVSATLKHPDFRVPTDQPNAFFQPFSPSFSPSGNGYDQYLTETKYQNMYGVPQQQLDPYGQYYQQPYGLQQSIHYPGAVPNSPGRGHNFPQQMQGHYTMPGPYGQPPQAQSMSRTPSNMSERPSSAVAQPSTPAMTNVNHVSHTHTPSATSGSPAPGSNFTIPAKKASKAIIIKTADGEVVNFNKKGGASPAPTAQLAQPPRSPAIVSTPTPPPRAPSVADSSHSRAESVAAKTDKEKQADFVKQFQLNLKAEKEKEEADKKAASEQEAKTKADADAKASKEKEEADAKAAQEKADAEKASKEQEEAAAAEKAKDDEAEKEKAAAEKKRLDEEEMERMIEEMEKAEREEEERQKAYEEKKKLQKEAEKAKEGERIKAEEEKLRKLERDAEEAEAARANETPEQKAERESLFAGLKKNTQFGPASMMEPGTSGASTPTAESSVPTITQPVQPKLTSSSKPKPSALKLDTQKPIEPAQPTAGMQSLKSARFLQVRSELVNYPEGILSPNPALNQGTKNKGRVYDKDFLLQFQPVFKEKPSVDWDMKLKETVGDSTDSARGPPSARPGGNSGGMSGRQNSRTSLGVSSNSGMGTFGQGQNVGRGLPPASMTSQQRFEASSGRAPMTNPLAHIVGGGSRGGFAMGPPQMARTASFQSMSQADRGPNSPRNGSSRGRGGGGGGGGNSSRRGPREHPNDAKAMPLTAGADLKPLEKSKTGWVPHGSEKAPQPGAVHMAPDMVQRKVKGALNKMTPEKFEKLADQILEIAAQSKDESDGRTLRQVIQLTFEKACDEAHWASMYAKFCNRMLTTMSTDIKDENVTDKHGNPVVGGALFRKYLLNRCQEEFERGWEVNLPDKPEGQVGEAALLTDDYYIAAAAKRKGLGLIQFIGELYKLGMLTLRIMHECVLKLLDFEGLPDESAIESLVKLLRTVGYTMESTDTGPKMIAVYFERIEKIMKMEGLPSRLQFMLLDTIDLRRAGWKSKDDAKGPKTIGEIRQEAAAAQQAAEMERARSNQRGGGGGGNRMHGGRGDARSFSNNNNNFPPPQDYPTGRVQMDDLRKLSKGASGRNLNNASLGPSMLGSRSSSGRRGLGPGGSLLGRAEDSGNSSRTTTPPVQKEKESATHANSFRYVNPHNV
jgi:translation initiation factor 4G